MIYTTTKCPYCGFITRNRISGLPSVQIGDPLIECPSCKKIMLDPIQTEFEFMNEHQKNSFKSDNVIVKSSIGNLIFIIMGVMFLIFSFSVEGDYIVASAIIGILLLILGIYQIIKNSLFMKNKTLEKAIYRSLIRTSNKKYVEILTSVYERFNDKKQYSIFKEKDSFISQNKYFLTQDEVQEIEKEIDDFVNLYLSLSDIKLSSVYKTEHH